MGFNSAFKGLITGKMSPLKTGENFEKD